jgi:hypothetical protein
MKDEDGLKNPTVKAKPLKEYEKIPNKLEYPEIDAGNYDTDSSFEYIDDPSDDEISNFSGSSDGETEAKKPSKDENNYNGLKGLYNLGNS